MAVATKRKSEMASYVNNGHDVINYFAKFEKFIPQNIIIPSLMTIGSQMPELDRGRGDFPSFKIGCQNTPYKLGLKINLTHLKCLLTDLVLTLNIHVVFTKSVNKNQKAIFCFTCLNWIHRKCNGITIKEYEDLVSKDENISWQCISCNIEDMASNFH